MTVAIDGNVVNECLGGFVKLFPEKAFEEIAWVEVAEVVELASRQRGNVVNNGSGLS